MAPPFPQPQDEANDPSHSFHPNPQHHAFLPQDSPPARLVPQRPPGFIQDQDTIGRPVSSLPNMPMGMPSPITMPTPMSMPSPLLPDDSKLEYPLLTNPTQPHTTPANRSLGKSVKELLLAAILPIIAIAYLAFCYNVQTRTVILEGRGMVDTSPSNISTIKSGITSISILVITLALCPVQTLIQELKDEEFFRLLKRPSSTSKNAGSTGVKLNTLQSVLEASPVAHALSIVRRSVSSYFVAAFVAGFVALVVSTLAPAALSVQVLTVDDALRAFSVGAIPPDGVFNFTSDGISFLSPTSAMFSQIERAAAVAWAEETLGSHYMFGAPKFNATTSSGPGVHLVPYPSNLPVNTRARWLTDIMILNPICQWRAANYTQSGVPLVFPNNASTSALPVNIPELDVDIQLSTIYYDPSGVRGPRLGYIEETDILNTTTLDPSLGGHQIWLVYQPVPPNINSEILIDFSGIPTFEIAGQGGNNTLQVAILTCTPNFDIETREVRNDGAGVLTVMPSNPSLKRQGNIYEPQAGLLLTAATQSLSEKSGPNWNGPVNTFVGSSQLTVEWFFGLEQTQLVSPSNDSSVAWTPAPLANITEMYQRIIQSSTKPFLGGQLGTAFVPGRTSHQVLAFTSSKPHVYISTVLLFLLSILQILSHRRNGKGEVFGLFEVASILDRSNMTREFGQFNIDCISRGMGVEETKEELDKAMGKAVVELRPMEDGLNVLMLKR